KGASSRVTVARHSYSVARAARWSASSSDFQKRRRLRRTYQFDSSSTSCSMGRAASEGSKPSRPAVTRRTASCSSERIQRSISVRCASSTGAAGSKSARFAYVTKNEYVFHSVEMNRLEVSPTRSLEKRRELPGGEAVYMYQR